MARYPAAMTAIANKPVAIGDPLPWIRARMHPGGEVNFEQFGGLRTALVFLGSATDARVVAVLERLGPAFDALRGEIPVNEFALVPVFAEPNAPEQSPVKSWLARAPVIVDTDLALHRAFGLASGNTVRIAGFVTDAQLIVRATVEFTTPDSFVAAIVAGLRARTGGNAPNRAPLLIVPDVFSAAECETLIAQYRTSTPEGSGYMMKSPDGKYRLIDDPARKVRSDVILAADTDLFTAVMERLRRRVFVQMRRYFMFETVALERILLARYGAAEGGHFRKHRDFGDEGSHREFGLTLNLNDGFAGGALAFPEFPGERHVPPRGAALVYSGAITHLVEPVTAGERFCLLSFMMGTRGMAQIERYKEAHGETIAAYPVPGGLPEAFSR